MMQATLRLPDMNCSCELYSRYLNRDPATKHSSSQTPSFAPFLGALREAFPALSFYLVGELRPYYPHKITPSWTLSSNLASEYAWSLVSGETGQPLVMQWRKA